MRKALVPPVLGMVVVLFMFGFILLAELEAADPSPTPTATTSATVDDPQVQPAQTEESRFPLPPPTREAVAAAPDNSGCISCHTSQEDLQELAKEPEAKESLSEGEG